MSTYIENISKEEEEKRQGQLNDLIMSLGMENADVAEQNEENIRKRNELLEKERLREIREEEEKFFDRRFNEEQKKRIAFEEEVRRREEEEKKRKEEEERLRAEKAKSKLYNTKETIKNGVLKVGTFFSNMKKDREFSPEDREKERLDRKAADLKKKEAELKKYEKEMKKRQEAEAAELKKKILEEAAKEGQGSSSEDTKENTKKKGFSSKQKKNEKIPATENETEKKTPSQNKGSDTNEASKQKISYQATPESRIANENDELRGVVKKRVQVKKKPQTKNLHGVRVYEPIDVDYTNIRSAGEQVGAFIPPEGDGSYRVQRPTEEYITLKDRIKEIRQKTSMTALVDMIDDVTANKDRLIMIAVASNNMENLMLIRDTDKFLTYCEKMEDEICVSYIYAIYRELGATYYLQKPEEELLTKVFSDIGVLFATHQTVNGTMLASIPNIGIFKHIYI